MHQLYQVQVSVCTFWLILAVCDVCLRSYVFDIAVKSLFHSRSKNLKRLPLE